MEEDEGIWIDKEQEIGKVRAFGEVGVLRHRGGLYGCRLSMIRRTEGVSLLYTLTW